MIASMGSPRLTPETLQVLTAMAGRPSDRHYGLELAEEARLPKGSIYPMLARLERTGLVTSEWEEIDESVAGRRRRRYYVLTAEGARVAVYELDRMKAVAERLEQGLPALRRLFPEIGGSA